MPAQGVLALWPWFFRQGPEEEEAATSRFIPVCRYAAIAMQLSFTSIFSSCEGCVLLSQIKNDTMLMMSIGTAAKDGIQASRVVQAGQTMWLPLAQIPSTDVTVLPTGKHQLLSPDFNGQTAAVPLAFTKQ